MEEAVAQARMTRSFGFRYNGFLERDRLMEVLDGGEGSKGLRDVTRGERAA